MRAGVVEYVVVIDGKVACVIGVAVPPTDDEGHLRKEVMLS